MDESTNANTFTKEEVLTALSNCLWSVRTMKDHPWSREEIHAWLDFELNNLLSRLNPQGNAE